MTLWQIAVFSAVNPIMLKILFYRVLPSHSG